MSYNPFSFASGAELLPCYEDILIGEPSSMTIDDLFLFNAQADSMFPDNNNPSPPITAPITPDNTLPSSFTEFNEPNRGNNWEIPAKHQQQEEQQQEQHQEQQEQQPQIDTSCSEVELDNALALDPDDEEDDVVEKITTSNTFSYPPQNPPPMPGHTHHFYNYTFSNIPFTMPSLEQSSMFNKRTRSGEFKQQQTENQQNQQNQQQTETMCNEWDPPQDPSGEDFDVTEGFKLPASKSPVMEALVVCALNGWGVDILKNNRHTSNTKAEVEFRVSDFNLYYTLSRRICSKQRPTDDLGSRIKSLRRWFTNFPKKRDRCENSFNLTVKPDEAKKVSEIIEKNSRSLGLVKRRRKQ